MSWGSGATTVKLQGRYAHADGNPLVGARITVRASTIVTDLPTHIEFGPSDVISTVTDDSGYFSLDLRATDDPNLSPVNWAWIITEPLRGSARSISLPIGSESMWIDQLGDAVDIVAQASVLTTAMLNARGGVAKLGQDGVIPLALLPASIGGTGYGTGGGSSSTTGGVSTLDLARALTTLEGTILGEVAAQYATLGQLSALGTTVAGLTDRLQALEAAVYWTPAKLASLAGWWPAGGAQFDGQSLAVQTVPLKSGDGTVLVADATTTGVLTYSVDAFLQNSGRGGLVFTPAAAGRGVVLHDNSVGGSPTFVASTVVKVPAGTALSTAHILTRAGGFRSIINADSTVRLLAAATSGTWAVDVTTAAPVVAPGTAYVWTVIIDGTSAILRINGQDVLTAPLSGGMGTVTTPLSIGSAGDGTSPLAGVVGDVVLVHSTVGDVDLAQLEAYLATTAGIAWSSVAPASDGHGDTSTPVSSATFADDFGDSF